MSEANIVQGIVSELEESFAYVIVTRKGGAGRNGIADILACYHGRFLALEVKQPGGRATKLQLHELCQARRAGAIAEIVCSRTEVVALLDQIDSQEAA